MIELNSAQCDVFMEEHPSVHVECTLKSSWYCVPSRPVGNTLFADTRTAAITAYWQKYHKDWTPPVVWNAETALEYMIKRNLVPGHRDVFNLESVSSCVPYPDGHTEHERTIEDVIQAIHDWKLKYDPDKPEPEETAVDVLKSIVTADATDLHLAIQNGYDFLKKLKEADDA